MDMYFIKKKIMLLNAAEMSIEINIENCPLDVERWRWFMNLTRDFEKWKLKEISMGIYFSADMSSSSVEEGWSKTSIWLCYVGLNLMVSNQKPDRSGLNK